MSLPNPGMDFVPFDILTAEELDNIVENIESLSDGVGLKNGVILPRSLSPTVGFYAEFSNGVSTRSSTNSNSWQRTPGGYTLTNSSAVAVKVQVVGSVMMHATASSVVSRASLQRYNGSTMTTFGTNAYHTIGQGFLRHSLQGEFTLDPSASVEIGIAIKVDDSSGNYMEIANATTDLTAGFAPCVQGSIRSA